MRMEQWIAVTVIQLMVVLSVVAYAVITDRDNDDDWECPYCWQVTVKDGNYHIDPKDMDLNISIVKYQLVDEFGGPRMDSDDDVLYGPLSEIKVIDYPSNLSFYEDVDDEDPLNGTDPSVPYYYIVFIDRSPFGMLDTNDTFIIRSESNGGVACEDDVFRIKSDLTKKTVNEVELPSDTGSSSGSHSSH